MLRELLVHPSERRILTSMLTTLVRRSALDAVGPSFDESLPIIADYELWLRLASRYSVGFLHSWDASYRRHSLQESRGARLEGEFLQVLEGLDSMLSGDLEHLRPPDGELERLRADWLLSLALTYGGQGRRRAAAAAVGQAGRLSPATLVDRRLPAILATLVLGRAAEPLLEAVRRLLPQSSRP
jgi:hypothetical protein